MTFSSKPLGRDLQMVIMDFKLEEKPEWGPLATFLPNKDEPIYNWFYYKEGFAKELVLKLADAFMLKQGTVLAPFCGCYDDKTEVLTKDGWKLFRDITELDELATLNPLTHEIEYHRYLRMFHYNHSGKMYRIKSKQVDLLVTPNHKMYIAK